jgi:hypothetical protein
MHWQVLTLASITVFFLPTQLAGGDYSYFILSFAVLYAASPPVKSVFYFFKQVYAPCLDGFCYGQAITEKVSLHGCAKT